MYKFTTSRANFSRTSLPLLSFSLLLCSRVLGGPRPSTSSSQYTSPLSRGCFSSCWHLHLSWLISCSGASWDSSSCCQIFVLREQLIWNWLHAPSHMHTLTHAGLSVHKLVFVCWCVHLCMWMIAALLIPVCVFRPLDQRIDHLAKLQEIKGTAVFTAEVQLLCLQMNGWVKRWRELKGRDSHFLSIFRKLAELALTYIRVCANEIYCSAKSVLIENNPCFTCGQCKFHFLEHLYCPFIYFPVSSLLSLALMRCSVPLPHKLKPFRWITSP